MAENNLSLTASRNGQSTLPFGHSLRQEFLFASKWLNLNHGSFGTIVRPVRDALRGFQDQMEERPDAYLRYEYPVLLNEARASIASLLSVAADDVVFVPNATTAINTVFRNLVFARGDVVIYFATIYAACEKTLEYIKETTPVETRRIDFTYPVSDAFLVDQLKRTIRQVRSEGKNPRIAVFDTIVALPGVRMPFERLTQVCKTEGVLSCIDGAHAVGMLDPDDLNLSRLDPDFFFSNCHKWLFSPRGCAVFYVPKRNQPLMRSSLPTSHGFVPSGPAHISSPLPPGGPSAFVENFAFVATVDPTPYACVPAALAYRRQRLGGERVIARHLRALARRGGDAVAAALGTAVLDNKERTLRRCAFANVGLPLDASALLARVRGRAAPREEEDGRARAAALAAMGNALVLWMVGVVVREYDTFMALYWYGGSWWVRLSAQVYLEEGDFERAGQILRQVCDRVEKLEFLESVELAKL